MWQNSCVKPIFCLVPLLPPCVCPSHSAQDLIYTHLFLALDAGFWAEQVRKGRGVG